MAPQKSTHVLEQSMMQMQLKLFIIYKLPMTVAQNLDSDIDGAHLWQCQLTTNCG